jgi:hypothetical protein
MIFFTQEYKLKCLEEYKENEEKIKEHIIKLENELIEVKSKQEKEVYELEKNHLFDKDRLKNEMKTKLNELASEFRHLCYDRMTESSKKLLKENVYLNSKINSLSNSLQSVCQENERLKKMVRIKERMREGGV